MRRSATRGRSVRSWSLSWASRWPAAVEHFIPVRVSADETFDVGKDMLNRDYDVPFRFTRDKVVVELKPAKP